MQIVHGFSIAKKVARPDDFHDLDDYDELVGRRLGDSDTCNSAEPLSCDDDSGCDSSCDKSWSRRRTVGSYKKSCDKGCNHRCGCDGPNTGGGSTPPHLPPVPHARRRTHVIRTRTKTARAM